MGKYNLNAFDNASKYSVNYLDCDEVVTPEFLWKFRNDNNLTQVRLANMLNVSKKTIEKWEQGKNPIKGASAVLIYLLEKNPELMNSLIDEEYEESKIQVEELEEENTSFNLEFASESEYVDTNLEKRVGNARVIASV